MPKRRIASGLIFLLALLAMLAVSRRAGQLAAQLIGGADGRRVAVSAPSGAQ